jgi:PAS domain S-box-containing protein
MADLESQSEEVAASLQRAASGDGLTPELAERALGLLRELQRAHRDATASLESEISARSLFEVTSDGLWDWNLTNNQVRFSPQWKAALGFEDHEVEDNVSSFFRLLHPDDLARIDAKLKAHFSDRMPYSVQLRMKTKAGGWRYILARGQAVWDEDGKPIRIAGTHTDITLRVEQERALLDAKEEQIAIQKRVIAALGCPVLQVKQDVLCVPLIGPFERERAGQLTEELLSAVVRLQARVVILDLTGAQLLDASSVQHISQVLRAVQLLGARCAISGVNPAMARVMVELSASFGDAPSYLTLASALAAA